MCLNRKVSGSFCAQHNKIQELFEYAKNKLHVINQIGKGKIRISSSGCMGRCTEGPVLVIYPDGIWYRYQSQSDIDEIINEHLLANRLVSRLLVNIN